MILATIPAVMTSRSAVTAAVSAFCFSNLVFFFLAGPSADASPRADGGRPSPVEPREAWRPGGLNLKFLSINGLSEAGSITGRILMMCARLGGY